jgi:hypothetical protein
MKSSTRQFVSSRHSTKRLFRYAFLCALAMLAHGCATIVSTPVSSHTKTATSSEAIAQWNRVLEDFVDANGFVDFNVLADKKIGLETYISFVKNTPYSSIPAGAPRLAHFINSYNALSMYNVIDLGIPESNASLLARYNFFIRRKFVIGGETMSLYDYENKVIRVVGDSRVHWALNCSAVGCPTLPRKAFTAENLDAELDAEARKFFSQSRNLRVDHEKREVWLSEIFQLFPEDFVPKHGENFIDYANKYVATPIPRDYTIRIVPYDWTIANSRRKTN